MKKSFLIIIPVHNEEKNIKESLHSIINQTFKDYYCILVNDGSSDNTQNIIEKIINNKPNFKLINRKKSSHSPGEKVVNAFNAGLNEVNIDDFKYINKFDADIIFPNNYLEEIDKIYSKNSKIGMASGIVYILKDNKWVYENISSKNHVRGPIKSYKKECFIKIGGLKPILGWDNIDVLLTNINGYIIETDKNLCVKHLRPTADKYKNEKAKKLGEYFYNIGLSFPLAIISSAKHCFVNKSFIDFYIILKSYLKQNHKLLLTSDEIKKIRKYRWQSLLKK